MVYLVLSWSMYAHGVACRSDFRPCIEWRWHLGCPGDRSGEQERGRTAMPRRGCFHGAKQTGRLREDHPDDTGMWCIDSSRFLRWKRALRKHEAHEVIEGACPSRGGPCRVITRGIRCEWLQAELSSETRGTDKQTWESGRTLRSKPGLPH